MSVSKIIQGFKMPNFITIRDDIKDVDVRINLNHNKTIQISSGSILLLSILSEKLRRQLINFEDCYPFYLSPNPAFEESDITKVKGGMLESAIKKYKNVVIVVEEYYEYKYHRRPEIEMQNFKHEINSLLESEQASKFTTFYLTEELEAKSYTDKQYKYGTKYLHGIRYSDCPALVFNFNNSKRQLSCVDEKLCNRLEIKYYLACMEIFARLKLEKSIFLMDEDNGMIAFDDTFCLSDIDDILHRYYLYNPYFHIHVPEKIVLVRWTKEIVSSMKRVMDDTTFSEIAKTLLWNKSKALLMIGQNYSFKEWECFEHESFWRNVDLKLIRAFYESFKSKQEYIKQCANTLANKSDPHPNVVKFISLLNR